mmetsp:Transcript_22427/g.66114  ORF Transcript_22427/g.66114 Transcript_22427/m.66114 type:complete len:317 (-) Transcript_22427:30-980(-)
MLACELEVLLERLAVVLERLRGRGPDGTAQLHDKARDDELQHVRVDRLGPGPASELARVASGSFVRVERHLVHRLIVAAVHLALEHVAQRLECAPEEEVCHCEHGGGSLVDGVLVVLVDKRDAIPPRPRPRPRPRGYGVPLIDENDQNAVNEAPAPMLTMADFLLWRALKALRNVLKRKVDRSDDEAVDKMALDAYKAAGRYARQLARWTRSKPVYPHMLQFIVPRLVMQLRGAIWSASTQALEHDCKTLKKDLELTSKHGKNTRFKRRHGVVQAMRNRKVREHLKLDAHKDAAARTTKRGALRTKMARPASQARA